MTIAEPTDIPLESPWAALEARNAFDEEVTAEFQGFLATFLSEVRQDAIGSLSAQVMVAGGDEPFTLGRVLGRWKALIGKIRESLSWMDPLVLSGILIRLTSHSMPADVFESAKTVLLNDPSEAALTSALSSDSPQTVANMGNDGLKLELAGMAWVSLMDRLSRTEASNIFNSRALSALVSAGYAHKQWVTMHDSRVRTSHRFVGGMVIPIQEAFPMRRCYMMYPGDPNGLPEELANCRCILTGRRGV